MTHQNGRTETGGQPLGRPLGGVLFAGIERFGDATALVCQDGSQISFADLAARADAAARLIGQKRALLTVQMENEIEPIAFYIGALRAGHVVIPNGGGQGARSLTRAFGPNGDYARTDGIWKLTRIDRDPIEMSPDLAVLLSTSGSTGSQKLVRLSHRNLISNALSIAKYLEFQPGERAITSLPAYYSYGISILHSHLLLGHTIVLCDHSVSDPAFWETVSRERVTSVAGVPHSYELMELSGFLDRDFEHLRYLTQAGGKLAPSSVQKFAQWAEQACKRFYVMYGQTEAGPRMAYLPPADAGAHADCVGLPIPGGQFRLAPIEDAAGLPDGAGELVYKGRNVMMGYAYSRADLAKPQGPDEIRTGDIAVRNELGFYRIVGRISRFAKLFGLRLSFDDIEARLAAGGIVGAVTGDDTGLDVAITAPACAEEACGSLAADLGIPATLISVVAVDEIPRLPSGKTDYAGIRRLRPEPAAQSPASLSAAIGVILGQSDIDMRFSFSELGGDSLNYVQTVLTLEKFLGYVPHNWESTPIRELEQLSPSNLEETDRIRTNRTPVSIQGLDLARSIAIIMALMTHAFLQVDFVYPPEVSLLPRIATPMLIMLFGAMIPLLYVPRAAQSAPGEAFQAYLTKSLQCYCLYVLNVFVIWTTMPSSWVYALGSLALLGAMPYAQILIFYTLMFLLIPAILFVLKRVNFWLLFAGSLAIHAAFLPLKMVPTPPTLGGQPVFQRLLDLLIGAGATPEVAGPSILHSFVLLLAGCWIGASIKRSADQPNPRLYFIRQQMVMAALFAVALVFAFAIPNYPVDWTGLTNMQLRNLNHPAYVFIFGALCICLLCALLVSKASARAPAWLTTVGRRSLFGFGIGNAIIVLWPKGGLPFLSPLMDGLLLLGLLVALIYWFDHAMRLGRAGRGTSRWAFEATTWGARTLTAISRGIVSYFLRPEELAERGLARR